MFKIISAVEKKGLHIFKIYKQKKNFFFDVLYRVDSQKINMYRFFKYIINEYFHSKKKW